MLPLPWIDINYVFTGISIFFNTSLPASIYNIEPRLLMNHQSLCLAVFLKPGKAIFSLITQHNNTNQIQPSLHPAETDNTEII